MLGRLNRIMEKIREELRDRKDYFCKARGEIADANLKVLMIADIAALFLLVIFILLTPLVIRDWKPTVYHISFIPALACFCAGTAVHYFRKSRGEKILTVLSLIFMTLVNGFCILLDTAGTPEGAATFTAIMFIILPCVFILPLSVSYSFIAVMEILYIVAIKVFKEEQIGQYDIFASIAALACSVIVANMIMHLRVQDYKIKARYKQLSMKDSLTDMLNKRSTLEAFEEYLRSRDHREACSLIIMDLDDFKEANDTLGHAAGDTILNHAGRVLHETFRRTDIIGRFGGDEFIILVKGAGDEKLIHTKCIHIQKRLQEKTKADTGMKILASFGAVVADGGKVGLNSLFHQADTALYEAKRQGKAHCVIHRYNEDIIHNFQKIQTK